MFNVAPMGLGKPLREFRLAKKWTLEKLEQESGVATGTISALENRDSTRSQYFPVLAQAMGITVEDLTRAAGQPGYVSQLTSHMSTRHPPIAAEPNGLQPPYGLAPILAWEHEDDLPPGEFVMVPRLDVHLSAGGGRDQVEIVFAEAQPQAFRADWIRKMGLRPNKLASMTASGQSMEDRIHDGDALVIDTSQVDVKDGGVYALWYDGGERVKRLYRLPGGGLRIHSDNPDKNKYPDIVLLKLEELEHVRIIGRVVHQSGTGGL